MKALVKVDAAPGLELTDVADPQVGPGDVAVKVLRTGICGTDLHIDSWDDWAARNVKPPLVLGHEFVGEVVETGRNVTGVKVGDLVSGEGHLVCGACRNCKAGRRHLCANTAAWACTATGRSPSSRCCRSRTPGAPHRGDLDVAAIFDPLGNAVHTALSFPVIGEDVLITGAGPIGIMAAAIARHAGARHVVITDVSGHRLELARKVGVDLALNVAESTLADAYGRLNMSEGFDVGMEMSGQPSALRDMIANMSHGGRIAMLGLPAKEFPVDFGSVVLKMLHLKGIYGREMFETWYSMSVLLQAGLDIAPVVTHRFHYTEHKTAFDTTRAGRCGKVLLDWTEK